MTPLPEAGTPVTYPIWLPAAANQVDSLRALEENWDGYDADAPRRDLILSASGFLLFLARNNVEAAPYVSPTRSGGVSFTWERGPHLLDVRIVSPGAASYVYLDRAAHTTIEGALFQDSADDGKFLGLLEQHFAA